jgi:MoxR-like ATPase
VKNYLQNSESIKAAPSPRSSIALHKGARTIAFLEGRDYAIPDDVRFLLPYTFRHRIFLKPEAIADEITPAQIISEMLDRVPVPRG